MNAPNDDDAGARIGSALGALLLGSAFGVGWAGLLVLIVFMSGWAWGRPGGWALALFWAVVVLGPLGVYLMTCTDAADRAARRTAWMIRAGFAIPVALFMIEWFS